MTAFLPILALAAAGVMSQTTCDYASLNTTVGTYLIESTDTIFTIAASVDRGVCDIARANRMTDAEYIAEGWDLIIPAEVCTPDDTTCLLVNSNSTSECINGGPHTYTTVTNDTARRIAEFKFAISVDALNATLGDFGVSGYDDVIVAGNTVKIPQCSPSQCEVQPYKFTFGTYKDLAEDYNTTVGQIDGFNAGYTYSSATDELAPVITLPMNCVALSDNITIMS